MLTDINNLRTLFSAIFIFLGAAVFYIASLISGRNIFRDISLQLALLVSTIVGFLLFAFSPISYLVFSPKLFGIDAIGVPVWTSINQQIEQNLFFPFVLAAAGFGSVIGTLNAINARALLLAWLRTKAMLNYPILTYDRSWDAFLLSLKKGGVIRLIGKGEHEICAGKLKSFSIREELREVTVEYGDKFRLINAADLEYMEAPKKSFKKHRDTIAHQAEAFYLTIAAAGSLLLVVSTDLTSTYLGALKTSDKTSDFQALANLYTWFGMILILVTFLFISVSFFASRQDFSRLSSYLVLCPSVPRLLLIETYFTLVLFIRELERLKMIGIGHASLLPWVTLPGAAVLALIVHMHFKKRELRSLLEQKGTTREQDQARKKGLSEVCELIYLETDLNQSGPLQWHNFEHKVRTKEHAFLLKDLSEKIHELTRNSPFLWYGPQRYLAGEDINIVSYLLATLEKVQRHPSPAQVIHEDTTARKDMRMQS